MIERDILQGKYKTDASLPSINTLSQTFQVSRDTVFKALTCLKERKMIDSTPGKGYFVMGKEEKIFLLLDEYSSFKNTLYNSLIRNLGSKYKVDLWFHQYNEHIFSTLLREAIGRYHYYLVMNFDNEKFSPILRKINPARLLLLDFGKFDKSRYSYICQDFDQAFYDALEQMNEGLKKYRKIVFLLPKSSKHPRSSVEYLEKYCKKYHQAWEVLSDEISCIEKHTAYIVLRDIDIVCMIKLSRKRELKCGQDFGLMAYNEIPVYQVIDNGITSLSIDWEEMGKLAAQFVVNGKPVQTYLPTIIHWRSSI